MSTIGNLKYDSRNKYFYKLNGKFEKNSQETQD